MADTNDDQKQRNSIDTEFDLLSDSELTDKHLKILEAAVRIFSEKGFSASRTSEIAKEASVSEGTIFNYFKTKKDLLVGLLIPLVTRFFRPLTLSSLERIFSTRNERSIEEVLQDVALDRVHLVQKNLPLIKIVAAEAFFHPELTDPLREEVVPKLINTMSQYFQHEIDNGTFREMDPKLLFRIFSSMIFGYILARNVLPEEFGVVDEEEEINQLIYTFINGVKKQR